MTTIGPKTANVSTLITDLAAAMINSGGWEDADTYVENNQNSDDWHDNGRALYHTASDQYLTFFPDNHEAPDSNNADACIVFVSSTDWDGTGHHPAGLTNDDGRLPFSGSVANDADASFDQKYGNKGPNWRITQLTATHGYSFGSRSGWAGSTDSTYHYTYSICVESNHVTVTKRSENDTNYGAAGIYTWEHLDSKFWQDGEPPLMAYARSNSDAMNVSHWQFNILSNKDRSSSTSPPLSGLPAAKGADYGFINSDPDDDTYFFERPLLQDSATPRRPIAHPTSVIPNDPNAGGNHGDTVTHNGDTYRLFNRSGASESGPVTIGYKWQ